MPGPGDNREALLWVSHCEVGTRCSSMIVCPHHPRSAKWGPGYSEGDPRASTCAEAMAISRKPTGRKSDMMLANSSRTSFVADSLNIPWSTSAQTRWAVARRLAGRPPSVVQRLVLGVNLSNQRMYLPRQATAQARNGADRTPGRGSLPKKDQRCVPVESRRV